MQLHAQFHTPNQLNEIIVSMMKYINRIYRVAWNFRSAQRILLVFVDMRVNAMNITSHVIKKT